VTELMEPLLEELIATGVISDADKARRRLRLGYPPWFVLGDMDAKEASDVLSWAARSLPVLEAPQTGESPHEADWAKGDRRLRELLVDPGHVSEEDLSLALEEQERSGGQLSEILLAYNVVDAPTLTSVLARELDLPVLQAWEEPKPLLPASQARAWRAVALSEDPREAGESRAPLRVAFSDPSEAALKAVQGHLQRPIQPKLTDEGTLNRLLSETYGEEDAEEAITSLFEREPHLSAYRSKLSSAQLLVGGSLATALVIGSAINVLLAIEAAVSIASIIYILYMVFRFYTSWIGWSSKSSICPSIESLKTLNERELPVYTVLLPVYGEKPSTLRELFSSLSKLDYPRQKLDGLLLVEADDRQTQEAIAAVSKPGWLKVLPIPPTEPRTKPKAMIYGMFYARGELLTVYDAEDQPDPYQLKKAAWAFQHLKDESVACLQAKLNYYNPRQNLLTRWFTLEYSAWFDMFLPGLHEAKAPIPLGGTSNHFRTSVLKEALSWDPYNVTEDADLGLRLARMGKRTVTLDSTTYEEANSRLKNWIRQRSRWIKGYMQTFLVHTRHPIDLYREIGLKSFLIFLATIGGTIFALLLSPVFWAILILWVLAHPGWVPSLFPGPIYYTALASFLLGNFFFAFLGLIAAIGRGQDDLTLYALLVPFYWLLMSIAGYIALFELIVRPYYWQKTEHGLHLEEDIVSTSWPADAEPIPRGLRG
jgi:cellulose synthase/poly-beta-1,6-N-acetylglucosamine synthase-like glycosyltransferase